MFWRRNKNLADEDVSPLHVLASRLGVERRFNPRAKVPENAAFVTLPTALFGDQIIRMRDLSVGGCCLWDNKEVLGPQIGQEIRLSLRWSDSEDQIQARIVSRVDHRRHIQFMDLPAGRQEQIKNLIAPGIAGLDVRPASLPLSDGPVLEAREVWTSLKGDSLTIEDDVHRVASVHIRGHDIFVMKEAWPVVKDKCPASPREFEALLLFLANIPNPSQGIKTLLAKLVKLSTARSV